MLGELRIYCVDVGAVRAGNFAWARLVHNDDPMSSADPEALVAYLAWDLSDGFPVALGFECPLYVPLAEKVVDTTRSRACEKFTDKKGKLISRPWSAGAGCAVTTTGLGQTIWLLHALKSTLQTEVSTFLDWDLFKAEGRGLFVWEAFVTGDAKASDHQGDATIAVKYFVAQLPDIPAANADRPGAVLSLIGSALLRTGWSQDLHLLETPCVVLRV